MVQVLSTCRDYDGRTPLHLAASEGREAVVRCLLQPGHGMHLGAKDRNDNTPLANAAKHRHLGVVSLLVEAGAPLGLAQHRLSGILCSLTQARDHDGLRIYIAAKADVTAADYDHRTALPHLRRRTATPRRRACCSGRGRIRARATAGAGRRCKRRRRPTTRREGRSHIVATWRWRRCCAGTGCAAGGRPVS